MFHRPPRIFLYDQGRSTALLAIFALAFFNIVNVIILVLAVVSILPAHSQRRQLGSIHDFPSLALASLGLNIYVTLNTEIAGLVHHRTLIFLLLKAHRLEFCSNLRLFKALERKYGFSNSWIGNALMAVSLVLSYTASSLCLVGVVTRKGNGQDDNDDVTAAKAMFGNFGGAYVFGIPMLILGFALLAQSLTASWGYFDSSIPTWSPNPVDVASSAAAKMSKRVKRRPDRCLRTAAETGITEDDESFGPLEPREFQPSLWETRSDVRMVLRLIWAFPLLLIIGFGVVFVLAIKGGTKGSVYGKNWSLLPSSSSEDSTIMTPSISIPWSSVKDYSEVKVGPAQWVWTVLLIAALQTALTLTLHCCELIVCSHRDESIWRQAATDKGLSPRTIFGSLVRSPSTLALAASKCILHWIFGLSFGILANAGFLCRPPQILYLTVFMLILVTSVTLLAHKKHRGPQPSTYGHVQTLLDAVDVYSTETIWWGHKSTAKDSGICHAGTETHKLGELSAKCSYQ